MRLTCAPSKASQVLHGYLGGLGLTRPTFTADHQTLALPMLAHGLVGLVSSQEDMRSEACHLLKVCTSLVVLHLVSSIQGNPLERVHCYQHWPRVGVDQVLAVTLVQVVQDGGLVEVTEAGQVWDCIQDGRVGWHALGDVSGDQLSRARPGCGIQSHYAFCCQASVDAGEGAQLPADRAGFEPDSRALGQAFQGVMLPLLLALLAGCHFLLGLRFPAEAHVCVSVCSALQAVCTYSQHPCSRVPMLLLTLLQKGSNAKRLALPSLHWQ